MQTTDTQNTAPTATIYNLQDYGAALHEIVQTAGFIADTATLLESHRAWDKWDGTTGNPTPHYLTQLMQLIRQAANKQLHIVDIMSDLVSESVPITPSLDVMEIPEFSTCHSQ